MPSSDVSPDAAPGTWAIESENLSKIYREGLIRRRSFQALQNVSFQVTPGTVFGLLGPNGAGKTTFVKTLLGIIRKTSGHAQVFGLPAGSIRARQTLGYLPERLSLPPYLTGYQCLEYCGGLSGMRAGAVRAKRDQTLELVGLSGWGSSLVRKYSKGMMQRLGLAQALIHQPRLLILDEPTDGLDPKARAGVREILHRLAGQGVTIFLNSHLLQEVEQLCRDVAIMAEGTVRYCGPVDQVSQFIDQSQGVSRGLELEFEVLGDPEQWDQWQNSHQWAATVDSLASGSWKLQVSVSGQDDADAIVDTLRSHRLSIGSMARRSISLEDSFLKLVGQELDDGRGAMQQAGKRSH